MLVREIFCALVERALISFVSLMANLAFSEEPETLEVMHVQMSTVVLAAIKSAGHPGLSGPLSGTNILLSRQNG